MPIFARITDRDTQSITYANRSEHRLEADLPVSQIVCWYLPYR
nr:hypothetical protein [Kibdelosporangium sp. MJ126-NF4]